MSTTSLGDTRTRRHSNAPHPPPPHPPYLSDAAVGELGAGGQVQLLQPAEGGQRRAHVVPQALQVLGGHHPGPLLEGQPRRLEEAHDAEGPGEARTLVPLRSNRKSSKTQLYNQCFTESEPPRSAQR